MNADEFNKDTERNGFEYGVIVAFVFMILVAMKKK